MLHEFSCLLIIKISKAYKNYSIYCIIPRALLASTNTLYLYLSCCILYYKTDSLDQWSFGDDRRGGASLHVQK